MRLASCDSTLYQTLTGLEGCKSELVPCIRSHTQQHGKGDANERVRGSAEYNRTAVNPESMHTRYSRPNVVAANAQARRQSVGCDAVCCSNVAMDPKPVSRGKIHVRTVRGLDWQRDQDCWKAIIWRCEGR